MEFLWLTDRSDSRRRIAELRAATQTHLLTTRLDTDDAISRDFVSRLQNTVRKRSRRYFLNMPDGLIWNNGEVAPKRHRSNQFISCCEPFDGFQTVHCGPKHTKLSTVAHVWQVGAGKPAWMYTYHGHNVWLRGHNLDVDGWQDESMVADRFRIDTSISLLRAGPPSPATRLSTDGTT